MVPGAPSGDAPVEASVNHVVPGARVKLSMDEGKPGDNVTLTGDGFKAFASVEYIRIGGADVTPAPRPATDRNGEFTATILVPDLAAGTNSVEVKVGGVTAHANFKVLDFLGAARDRAALVALYNATDGGNWTNNTNWLTDAPLSQWHGVETDSTGRVTDLHLSLNQLSGEIPAELGDLTNLYGLHLSDNQLTGEIPAELGSLTNLTWLHLGYNQLSGEIPAELGGLTNLHLLWLENNQLSGGIPVELGSLTNLTVLVFDTNQLSGEIPAELSSLTNLQILGLGGNQLSGEIPTELGGLTNLDELWLEDNQLSGGIPVELGSLTNLTGLGLSGNQLSGEIPAELGKLSNLQSLWLRG